MLPKIQRLWYRFIRFIKLNGPVKTLRRAYDTLVTLLITRGKRVVFTNRYLTRQASLLELIESHSFFFDLSPSPIGWDAKMFQRYQHIAKGLAEVGGLALYGGHPSIDKNLFVYSKIQENLYIFDATDQSVKDKVLSALVRSKAPKIVRLYSIDLKIGLPEVLTWLKMGFKVVYEYIDLLTPEIVGFIPPEIALRHQEILRDERIFVVATSNKLFEDVQKYRSSNFILSTNGVDINHWKTSSKNCPADLSSICSTGRYIVGYHGTLAEWIDYECLRAIADEGRYEVLLIGLEHDRSFKKSGLHRHPRLHYLGSKPYSKLNEYVAYYDVAILPFIKNDVTDTVSPVKIFEYMAAGKPIVSTDLLECKKYRSCLIAHNTTEFLEKLETALFCRQDASYLTTLAVEAQANSWRQKAREILLLTGIEQ